MADKATITKLLQMKLQIDDPGYVPTIEDAIGIIWGQIGAMSEWWFLRASGGKPISLVVGTDTYKVGKPDTLIGKMLHIANSVNKKIYLYRDRRQWDIARDAGTTANSGSPAIFTDLGLSSGERFIQLDRKPAEASTVYLHYQEVAILSNLDKLPVQWSKVLLHGVMSLLAPPRKINQNQWQALTFGEDRLFQFWIDEMIRLERGAEDGQREMELDAQLQTRLDEVNNL